PWSRVPVRRPLSSTTPPCATWLPSSATRLTRSRKPAIASVSTYCCIWPSSSSLPTCSSVSTGRTSSKACRSSDHENAPSGARFRLCRSCPAGASSRPPGSLADVVYWPLSIRPQGCCSVLPCVSVGWELRYECQCQQAFLDGFLFRSERSVLPQGAYCPGGKGCHRRHRERGAG